MTGWLKMPTRFCNQNNKDINCDFMYRSDKLPNKPIGIYINTCDKQSLIGKIIHASTFLYLIIGILSTLQKNNGNKSCLWHAVTFIAHRDERLKYFVTNCGIEICDTLNNCLKMFLLPYTI